MHELRIAENLIRLRHERKITQEELADYIGVTKGSVSPRARKTFVKDIAASLSHPLFEKLKDDNTFRRLQNQLKEMIE